MPGSSLEPTILGPTPVLPTVGSVPSGVTSAGTGPITAEVAGGSAVPSGVTPAGTGPIPAVEPHYRNSTTADKTSDTTDSTGTTDSTSTTHDSSGGPGAGHDKVHQEGIESALSPSATETSSTPKQQGSWK